MMMNCEYFLYMSGKGQKGTLPDVGNVLNQFSI